MSSVTLALLAAAIRSIGEIADQLSKGAITDEQAQEALTAAAAHYKAAVAAWNATPAPGE